MAEPRVQVTQNYVAKVAGVSQTTVSLVLSGRDSATTRISPGTRQRVLEALRSTGYVADITARRRPDGHRILGVFTSTASFPVLPHHLGYSVTLGVTDYAEARGCDLLLLTGAPTIDGRRRLLGDGDRPLRADGYILLGTAADRSDVAHVLGEGRPVVSVGQRHNLDVPYVDADYEAATATLVHLAAERGHRHAAYVGAGTAAERCIRTQRGFTTAVRSAGVIGRHVVIAAPDRADVLKSFVDSNVTIAFTERHSDAAALVKVASTIGLAVPRDLSIVALECPDRGAPTSSASSYSGFTVPYVELGWQAADLLDGLLTESGDAAPRLLSCVVEPSASVIAPAPRETS